MCDQLFTYFGTVTNTGRAIFTPQGYVRALKQALKKRNIHVNVEDIHVVPDYVSFMKPHIDKKLARCDKEEWTELQWTFEAVDHCQQGCTCQNCALYPTGVKVTYRKYSADNVVIVKEDSASDYGFVHDSLLVHTHPIPDKTGDPDGMYLLRSLPDGKSEFLPQPFIKGSRKHLETLVRKMSNNFGKILGVTGD